MAVSSTHPQPSEELHPYHLACVEKEELDTAVLSIMLLAITNNEICCSAGQTISKQQTVHLALSSTQQEMNVPVEYRARLGVQSGFRAGIRWINEKDLASTYKKLHPSDHLVS
jgi:hypothetical protein